MRIGIFDVDGTLCEISEERHKLIQEREWDKYHELGVKEKVINKELIASVNYYHIASGRSIEYAEQTMAQLSNGFGKPPIRYWMRTDNFTPNAVIKEKAINDCSRLYDSTVELVFADDDDRAIEMAMDNRSLLYTIYKSERKNGIITVRQVWKRK